jgi:hypothetical protein
MLDKTIQDWNADAAGLEIEGRAFIDGGYRDALAGETRPTVSPANGQKLADVANCGTEDADRAVAIARAAFDSGVWASMAPADRKMVLVRWAELIEDHADEIALLECLDVGKPIADTTGVDVPSAVRTIRWSGEAIDKVYDQISPAPADCLATYSAFAPGRRRGNRAVEFSALDHCLETRTVIGDGQFRDPQAGLQHAAVGITHRSPGQRSGLAGWCSASVARTRRKPWPAPLFTR